MSPVSSKGQITLPAPIRKKLGIDAGEDKVVIRQEGSRVVLEPVTGSIMDLFGVLSGLERKPVDFTKLRYEVRRRRVAERIINKG